jgi:hypothetical protein
VTTQEVQLNFKLRGGNAEIYNSREREVLAEGPRGTGKTRTILEMLVKYCHAFPGLTALIVRKYQRTLATTALRTLNEQVLYNGDGVSFFGGNEQEPASYRFPNGSRIVVGGMDNSEKVKSSEYSLIYVNEATELSEDDWEALLPLLRQARDGKPVIRNQRLIGDCNPSHSGHWLNQRAEQGKVRRIKTVMKDNPFYYDDNGNPTLAGEAYLSTLENLTGARRERWLEGKWTGVENAAYPIFDRDIHIRELEPGLAFAATVIGEDYGATHECGVVALSIDQYNRRWVREAWAQVDDDEGKSLNLTIAQFKQRYMAKRGRGDPNQRFLNDSHKFSTADAGAGSRQRRIDMLEPLFYNFAGGRVPSRREEQKLIAPLPHYAEPDSPGIFLVRGAPGIDKLASQIEGYHYIFTESQRGRDRVIYRDQDDLVAALEYANEEWEEGPQVTPYPKTVVNPLSRERSASPTLLGNKRKRASAGKEFNSI